MFPIIKFIGLKSRTKKSNFTFQVALLSVVIGLFSLNSLDMFSNGFKGIVTNKLSYLDGHIKITKIGNHISYKEYLDISKKLDMSYQVFPFIKKKIILRDNKKIIDMILISLPLEYFNISEFVLFEISDSITPNSLILSQSLLDKFNYTINDNCNVYEIETEIFSDLKPSSIQVSGSFKSDFKEYDNKVAYTVIEDFENKNFSGLIVNTQNPKMSNNDVKIISNLLMKKNFRFTTWEMMHSSFIDWLELFHIPIKIILFLITMVSSFSITSSLYLFIDEKKYHISLLKSIGYSDLKVKLIFLKIVFILSLTGMIIANVLTLILYFVQSNFGFISLPADVYFMSILPVELSFNDFIQNNIMIFLMLFTFSIYPIFKTKDIVSTSLRKYEFI